MMIKKKPVLDNLSKLSDVQKNDVVKKDACYAKIKDIEDKIPDIINLATNALNTKISKIKNKIPNITNLATNADLTAFKNKLPNHSKYVITRKFNKLAPENVTERLKQANLATKGDIADFAKKTDFDNKLKKNKNVT